MRPRSVEEQLRRFLLVSAVLIFGATAVELWFVEHLESTVQTVPFVLCGLGAGAALLAFWSPGRAVLLALRGVMVAVALGSVFGWYEHVAHNVAFELEIRPNAGVRDVFWEALRGASPLLAPGILALAAVLALAATYRHPALARHRTHVAERK